MGWRKRPAVIKKDPAFVSVLVPYHIGMAEIVSEERRSEDSAVENVTKIDTGDLTYE